MVNAVAVRVLCYLEARLAQRGAAVQLWAHLSEDTMDTGIYAHSTNPNGTSFPTAFPNLDWQLALPAEVAAILPATHRAGTASCDGSTWYVVQRQPAMVGPEARQ
ncbi:hypothetical protein XarbCFBP7408_17590 [Xanthomonas arboricola pv. guizotiae]|uniref:Uncharacterized protein n=2 Tax=Xanthomonas arboricola TaxID=56448 RepID=A0A2S6ZUR2_9XANT|nr:hypothetical protein XarbCFBP7409_16195 [Xanthomonas arboricola pv. guizotiae]PPU20613.1 hypothetical protein XarbCFBP7408_17590 [Xanthomonas arboricola pv. guizotiae]